MQETKNDSRYEQSPQYAMSAILVTFDGYDTIRYTVQALQRQTVKDEMELVIVGPVGKELGIIESDLEDFAGHQVLEMDDITSTTIARAAGIRAARAPLVVLTEDHSFPAPDWAEALILRHQEPWTGVGPRVCNANPSTAVSWANFLIEYGAWIAVESAVPLEHIPGHNGSYKREALLEYGSVLADMLEADSPMHWDMIAKGHTFCIEAKAKTYHLNFSIFSESLVLRFFGGRLFAARRAHKWSKVRRALYALGSPLIPLVRLGRILRTVYQIDLGKLIPWILPSLIVLLVFDGVGEMVGYAAGAGKALQIVSDREFHRERFIVERDRKLLEDIVKLTAPTT